MSEFRLDERLAADCIEVTDWPLCKVLLMNDKRFPWLILVPRVAGIRDLDEIPGASKLPFHEEIESALVQLRDATGAYKMNVAALGNSVEQFHVHVIARFKEDEAWPGPVWGVGTPVPYRPGEAEAFIEKLLEN